MTSPADSPDGPDRPTPAGSESRSTFAFRGDGAQPDVSSALPCGVCGYFALVEDSPHEFVSGLSNRLICQICGAHRVTDS